MRIKNLIPLMMAMSSLAMAAIQNNVWTGNAGDNSFTNNANWWNSLGSNDVAFFRGDSIDSHPEWTNAVLSAPATISAMTFQGSELASAGYNISGSAVLTLDGNPEERTTLIEIMSAVTVPQIISAPLVLSTLNNADNVHIKTGNGAGIIFAGPISQNSSSHGVGFRIGNGDVVIAGDLDGTGKLWKVRDNAGTGVLEITGTFAGGTLQIAANAEVLLNRPEADNLALAGLVFQMVGGDLTLGENEQIGDSVNLGITGTSGTFKLDGHTETLSSFGFQNDSKTVSLDMGDGGVLNLADQNPESAWGTLTVLNWDSGSDHIYVTGGSFSETQLAGITFDGYEAGAKVEGGELLPTGASLGFSGWIDDYSLAAGQDAADADPDGDGVANLYEYAFGGNPTNAAVTGTLPVFEFNGSTVDIVHVERTGAEGVISYAVQQTPALFPPAWTTGGISFVGESGDVDGFKTVTNQTTAAASVKFLKVFVEQD